MKSTWVRSEDLRVGDEVVVSHEVLKIVEMLHFSPDTFGFSKPGDGDQYFRAQVLKSYRDQPETDTIITSLFIQQGRRYLIVDRTQHEN